MSHQRAHAKKEHYMNSSQPGGHRKEPFGPYIHTNPHASSRCSRIVMVKHLSLQSLIKLLYLLVSYKLEFSTLSTQNLLQDESKSFENCSKSSFERFDSKFNSSRRWEQTMDHVLFTFDTVNGLYLKPFYYPKTFSIFLSLLEFNRSDTFHHQCSIIPTCTQHLIHLVWRLGTIHGLDESNICRFHAFSGSHRQ